MLPGRQYAIRFREKRHHARIGIELCGFGPFINRRALAVRDRLWARAMAVRQGDVTLALLAAPFEIFHRIKEDIVARAQSPIPLVLGITNDEFGYAPDHDTAARGGYAAQQAPLMLGSLPFRNIHDELMEEMLELEQAVLANDTAVSSSPCV